VDYCWQARDILPRRRFENTPPAEEWQSGVSFTSFKNWQEVADHEGPVWKKKIEPTPAIKTKAEQLIAGLTTEEEKVAAICKFCRDDIKYCCQHHTAGWIPLEPEKVLGLGQGDCKDTAALACSLLKAIGIKAYPVSISSADSGQMPMEIPCPVADHVIVLVEQSGNQTWFETTADYDPWNQLGLISRGRNGFLVDGEQIRLVKTPAVSMEAGRIEDDITITIAESASSKLELKRMYHGPEASLIREDLRELSAEDRKQELAKVVEARYSGFKLKSFRMDEKNLFNPDEPLKVEMDFEAPGDSKKLLVRSIHASPALLWINIDQPRDVDWVLDAPICLTESIQIKIPKSRSFNCRSSLESWEYSWGRGKRQVNESPDSTALTVKYELEIEKTRISPLHRQEFQQFRTRTIASSSLLVFEWNE
jgi:hypothetical protein